MMGGWPNHSVALEELVQLSLETSAGVVARAFCMLLAHAIYVGLFEMGWEREKKRRDYFSCLR